MVGAVDALAALDAAPPSERSADDTSPVLFLDGAIETGADVVRAVALGATAALIGRTVLWALVAGGEAAVMDVLERCLAGSSGRWP